MGICISLAISKSVTKEEWWQVYEESLKMVKAFPFAEKRKINLDGIDVFCLVKSEEREEAYGWNNDIQIGWETVGDYNYLHTAEDYYLPRNLVEEKEYLEQCEDALYGVLPAYLNYSWEDERFDITYGLWGAKTQGEPYHMYLLAVACMIESRLGNKAFIYGDITKGQCVKAVEMANEILENPINIPARCDAERLLERVNTLPITDKEKIKVFETFFLGNKDAEFGRMFRKTFEEGTLNEYWKDRFGYYNVTQVGFQKVFRNYLLWGFDFDLICDFVKFEDNEGKTLYEEFVKKVMDAKLHIKEKDCSDPLDIDQNESRPYSVDTLFAQFLFSGLKNRKIDRYIPIEDIRASLLKQLGDKCDVNGIIDEYLEKESAQKEIDLSKVSSQEEYSESVEQDSSEVFKQYINMKKDILQTEMETFDISEYEDLMFYVSGDSIHPGIMRNLGSYYAFYASIINEDHYQSLMNKESIKRCEFLVKQNRRILIRDKDWKKIFDDIKNNEDSFSRYYPMVRVGVNSDGVAQIVKGIVLNDELYKICPDLAEKYGNNGEKDSKDNEGGKVKTVKVK